MRRSYLIAASLAVAAVVGPATAAAPAPKKPIQFEKMMGRWYEVARTPNQRQKNCFAPYADWKPEGAGKAQVTNTCRKGSPTGPVETNKATARLVDAGKAKISMSFLLGTINQEYWILDRADDYSWSIMGTPGGNYVWVFSRQKTLTPAQRDALVGRARALGYPASKIEVVGR